MDAVAMIDASVADRAYGLAAGATDRVLDVYDVYSSFLPHIIITKHLRRFRLQRAISVATSNVQNLIDALDQTTRIVALHCEAIPVELRRNQPFTSMAEMLNGALYGLQSLRDQKVDGVENLYRLGAQARNKADRIASMLRQMEPPKMVFQSDFDRDSLVRLAQQTTCALDHQIKH